MTMTEKQVQSNIKRFLTQLGCAVSDLSQPRASMQTPGLPDLYVQHPELGTFWVEVKSPTGRTTPEQDEWHAREHAAGGLVLVARSAADLVEPLRQLGAPIS